VCREPGEQCRDDRSEEDVDPQALAHLFEEAQVMRNIESDQRAQARRPGAGIERFDDRFPPKVLFAAFVPAPFRAFFTAFFTAFLPCCRDIQH